jgi:hypothetical protein
MPYSLDDIAKLYGHSKSTLKRHMKDLKDKEKFIKSAPGKFYNDVDVLCLSKLLNFHFPVPVANVPGNPSLEFQARSGSLGTI